MGYEKYTVAGSRARSRSVRAPRTAFILTLLFSFVFSTVPSIAPDAAAAPHHMTAAHDDMTGAHETSHPCEHDCDCGKPIMSCCVQAASVAAIWASAPTAPQFGAVRCVSTHGGYLASLEIDPPTPPPRIVVG